MRFENAILLICVYPFVLLMYFLLKNEATPKKGLYYGVTLTREQAKELEAEHITKAYNKQMRQYLWILMLTPIPMLFIPWFSIYFLFWSVWFLFGIFAFFIPFARANTKLKRLKAEKGWKQQNTEQLVEIKSAGKVRKVKFIQFAVPCILSVGIFLWAIIRACKEQLVVLGITVGSLAFVTLLFYQVAVWMDKQPVQVVSMDSEVNLNYARAGKNLWKNFWITCAWVNTAYTFSMLFMLDKNERLSAVFIRSTVIYILVTIVLLIRVMKKKKKLDVTYQDRMDAVTTDEDDYWLWGIIYYNPKNKHGMVEKRVGIGTSTNMATPVGKGIVAFCCLMMLSLPAVSIWLMLLEFMPIGLSVTDGRLIAAHVREDYSIPVSIIEEVELLEELPKWSKVSGTDMEELQKGTFRVAEVGRCEVFLNPENGLFICFEAVNTTYYMSGYDDAETMEIYELLTE